jgi:hypothetical protein
MNYILLSKFFVSVFLFMRIRNQKKEMDPDSVAQIDESCKIIKVFLIIHHY